MLCINSDFVCPTPSRKPHPLWGGLAARIMCGCGRARRARLRGATGVTGATLSALRADRGRRDAARRGLRSVLVRFVSMWPRGARVSMPAARTYRPALAAALRLAYRRMVTRAPLSVMHRGCGGWPSCGHRHGVRGWAQVLRVSTIKFPVKEMWCQSSSQKLSR